MLCDGRVDLRLGRWQDVLADVTTCDAVITDPPYSERTHEGHAATATGHGGFGNDGAERLNLLYGSWSGEDVGAFVAAFVPRTRGWFAAMTSHDLVASYTEALESAGRYAFAPVPILQHRPRLGGDGPGSCAVYFCVARPRERAWCTWGSLPGWYEANVERGTGVVGAKPVGLMRAIVRDYTKPGDLVVDPFCGGGTTALACAMEGRRCITSEVDPKTYELARKRLAKGFNPDMFSGGDAA